MTDLEMHAGILTGFEGAGDPSGDSPVRQRPDEGSARRALERIILDYLLSGDCVVRFSGGRDSSLVLAVAAHVARREGLRLPAAVTVRYSGVPSVDETEWQRMVIAHLDVPHEVIEVPPGADELASPLAVAGLGRHGALFPPTAHITMPRMAAHVAGRVVLTGEGGDEVLGPSRITPFVAHYRWRRWPSGRSWGEITSELAPHRVRHRRARRQYELHGTASWLTSEARAAVLDGLASDVVAQPWDWRASRWAAIHTRTVVVGLATIAAAARRAGFQIRHPLYEPRFVRGLCDSTDRWGMVTRTDMMRLIASDLLPEALLTRTSKARFNNVYAGARVRAFVSAWDGSGVNADLVDVERLRSAWLAETPPAPSLVPLQLALVAALEAGWIAPESSGGR